MTNSFCYTIRNQYNIVKQINTNKINLKESNLNIVLLEPPDVLNRKNLKNILHMQMIHKIKCWIINNMSKMNFADNSYVPSCPSFITLSSFRYNFSISSSAGYGHETKFCPVSCKGNCRVGHLKQSSKGQIMFLFVTFSFLLAEMLAWLTSHDPCKGKSEQQWMQQ